MESIMKKMALDAALAVSFSGAVFAEPHQLFWTQS